MMKSYEAIPRGPTVLTTLINSVNILRSYTTLEIHHWSRPNSYSASTLNDRPKRWRNSDSQIPEEKVIPTSWYPSTITTPPSHEGPSHRGLLCGYDRHALRERMESHYGRTPPLLKGFKLTIIPASRSWRVFADYFLVSEALLYSRCRTALDRSVGLQLQIIRILRRTRFMNVYGQCGSICSAVQHA